MKTRRQTKKEEQRKEDAKRQKRLFKRRSNVVGRNDIFVDATTKKIKLELEEDMNPTVKVEQDEVIEPPKPGPDMKVVTVTDEVDIPMDSAADYQQVVVPPNPGQGGTWIPDVKEERPEDNDVLRSYGSFAVGMATEDIGMPFGQGARHPMEDPCVPVRENEEANGTGTADLESIGGATGNCDEEMKAEARPLSPSSCQRAVDDPDQTSFEGLLEVSSTDEKLNALITRFGAMEKELKEVKSLVSGLANPPKPDMPHPSFEEIRKLNEEIIRLRRQIQSTNPTVVACPQVEDNPIQHVGSGSDKMEEPIVEDEGLNQCREDPAHCSKKNSYAVPTQATGLVPDPQEEKIFSLFEDVLKVFVDQGKKGLRIDWKEKMPILLICRLVCKSWCRSVDCLLESHPSHLDLDTNLEHDQQPRYPFVKLMFDFRQPGGKERIEQFHQYFVDRSANNPNYNPIPTRHLAINVYAEENRKDSQKYIKTFNNIFLKHLEAFGKHIWYFQVTFLNHRDYVSSCSEPKKYTLLLGWLNHLPNLKRLSFDLMWNRSTFDQAQIGEFKFPFLKDLINVGVYNSNYVLSSLLFENSNFKKLSIDANDILEVSKIDLPSLSELWIRDVDSKNFEGIKTVSWKPEKLVMTFSEDDALGVDMTSCFEVIHTFKATLECLEIQIPFFDWYWFGDVVDFNLPRLKHLKLELDFRSLDLLSLEGFLRDLRDLVTLTVIIYPSGLKPAGIEAILRELETVHKLHMWFTMPSLKSVTLISKYRDCEFKIEKFDIRRPLMSVLRFCIQHDFRPDDFDEELYRQKYCSPVR